MPLAMPSLRIRDSVPWIGGGIAIAFAVIAILTATSGDEDSAWLAAGWWAGALAGFALVLRGALILSREVTRRQAAFVAGLAVLLLILAVLLHNAIYALFDFEEGVFFIIALFVAPVVLVAALLRVIWPGHPRADGTVSG